MKRRVGIILCISGIVLLIKPNFDLEQLSYLLNYCLVSYWPLLLVFLGISMLQKKPNKKTNKHKTI